jgi:hypothetical protein
MINPTGQRKRNIRCPVAIFILILLPKQDIVGSSPITRSIINRPGIQAGLFL